MPLTKDRELITVTTQAHKHLRNIVNAMKKNGIPANGTMIASQLILSLPIPQPAAPASVEKKRKDRKSAVPAL